MKIAVLCIGNRLMLDDGLGPAVYDELMGRYSFPEEVRFYDAGCMSMDLLPVVRDSDYVISVDAVDVPDAEPGTVYRFAPDEIGGHGVMQSLHDLRLVDLFNAAALLGYECDGICFGVQVENMSPATLTEGLTPKVFASLPLVTDCVLAELHRLNVEIRHVDGSLFVPPTEDADVEGAPSCDLSLKADVSFAGSLRSER